MPKKNNMKNIQIITVLMLIFLAFGCNRDKNKAQEPEQGSKTFKIEKKIEKDDPTHQSGKEKPLTDDLNAKPSEVTTQAMVPSDKLSDRKSDINQGVQPEKAGTLISLDEAFYDPKSRIDPFEPLFQDKKQESTTAGGKRKTPREKRVNLTPLEKFDISQLKLVAIIVSKHRNLGMVEEATGKGYVVKKGTYIGINSGRVVDIEKDKVIVEEEVEDYMGKLIIRKRELKLQKPLGE